MRLVVVPPCPLRVMVGVGQGGKPGLGFHALWIIFCTYLKRISTEDRPIRPEYYIVKNGALAGAGAHAYKDGDATGGAK